jgi:hypothetical protein|tara:strand:+ start:1574 stop:1756 length:183 start_codon:yes stop_codon:yes gene_type:complete
MTTIIKEFASLTVARDRQGEVISSFKGAMFTLIMRVFLVGLGLIYSIGMIGLILNIIASI